ncbi:MAG: DUF1538 domain-containing protein [Peptococcaceae bacterium]|jgi:hypothetical protein|nr:DUF1538 domain-containing protein [Peptococcaceae bacterium]
MDEVKKIALETLQSISPIVVMVIVLQLIFFDDPLSQVLQFAIGAVMVTVGLWLFLVGVQVGLLRIGEIIGSELPQRASFPVILLFVFIIGIAIIMAEPNIMVLSEQIGYVAGDAISKIVLITFVGVGLGLFLVIAVVRVFLGVPLKYVLLAGYVLVFALSYFVPPDFVPLSFDAGGVATGPLTVPFVMALGVGITSVISGKGTLSDSFGFIGLSALGPVLAVMLLGVIYT